MAGAALLAPGFFTLAFALAATAACLARFRKKAASARVDSVPLPPLTVFKPLKSAEPGLYEDLKSFCLQDYPSPLQIILALQSEDDSALPAAQRIVADFPALDVSIVVEPSRLGANPKISNLANALPRAKYDLWVISDSDVRVSRNFLSESAREFEAAKWGAASAFYRLSRPSGFWERLEAAVLDFHFIPGALVGAALGKRFLMGAVMLVKREAFEAAGIDALKDVLADDYWLGQAVARAGYAVGFLSLPVETATQCRTWREFLRRQCRSYATIRSCEPLGYAGLVLVQGFSLTVLYILAFGANTLALSLLAAIAVAKSAFWVTVSRSFRTPPGPSSLLLVPLAEFAALAAWVRGLFARSVSWRGQRFPLRGESLLALPAVAELRGAPQSR